MIASLPMYDWPETSAQLDLFWARCRSALKQQCDCVPTHLSRGDVHEQWQRDDMLLSQTCAYPLVTELPASTVVVGTPTFAVDYNDGGHYASVLLVASTDKRTELAQFARSILAYNGPDSQSGFNALKSLLVEQQLITDEAPIFFEDSVRTGSHRASIAAVATGRAHICAIDPVSWAMAQRYDQHCKQVKILSPTAFAPALPLVTSAAAIPDSFSEAQWREVVIHAFEQAIDSATREQLLFSGITYVPKSDYLKLPISKFDMITL